MNAFIKKLLSSKRVDVKTVHPTCEKAHVNEWEIVLTNATRLANSVASNKTTLAYDGYYLYEHVITDALIAHGKQKGISLNKEHLIDVVSYNDFTKTISEVQRLVKVLLEAKTELVGA